MLLFDPEGGGRKQWGKKSQHLSLDLDYMQNRSTSALLGEPNAYTPTQKVCWI